MLSNKPFYFSVKALSFMLALLLICAPQAATAQQQSQVPQATLRTRPLPPTQYIPSRDYDVRHIALDLRFDWEREQALGTATISFAPLANNLKQVEFDAANMTFNSVKLSNGAELQYEADAPHEKLRVWLDRAYQPSDVLTVVISYHTNGPTPQSLTGQGGLTFIKPTLDEPNRPRQIWSQGESEWNHQWFPCFDHPNDFATTEMTATVEKPLMVISNGRLIEKKDNADGTQTFHWKMEEPHASYLTSIVVGEFATIEQSNGNVPILSYVYTNQVEQGKVTVARVPEMMKLFEERTGVKFPNAKYGQSFVYGFGGGMENITATTMSDQTIHDARTELDKTQDDLLSHELAHSWFGDYVTCRSWGEIWLNEAFASYFEGVWNEYHLGHDDFLYMDVKHNQEGYLNAWHQGVRRPVVTKNYRDPDAVFDVYAYPRGAAVLHMLRKILGEEQWWRAVNYYLRKYPHQPVETEQFRIAIEEATGQPLEWFFDEWVYRMGHPVFRVTQNYDATAKTLTLKVRQEQTVDPENAYPQTKYFQTPVEIEIGTSAKTRVERVLIEPKEEQSFTFAVDAEPLIVNFDYNGTIIKELTFDKTTDALLYQLKSDEDMLGRMWALSQLAVRVRDGAVSEAEKRRIADGLGAALKGDKFWGMREAAAEALSGVAGEEARAALLAGTKDVDAHVRHAAVSSLAVTNDPSLANVYIGMLDDRSYETIQAAAAALGQTKAAGAFDALSKLVAVPSWRDTLRASALNGLAALGDARALELGIRYAGAENPRAVRLASISLLSAVGKNDPRVFPIISEAFTRAISSGSSSLTSATAAALVNLGDQRALQVFQAARNTAKRPEFQFLINQYEERLKKKNGGQ
ncbi:MAG TPA: M1 family aminopeptidase [Pyrinomonadaceae bacterium]